MGLLRVSNEDYVFPGIQQSIIKCYIFVKLYHIFTCDISNYWQFHVDTGSGTKKPTTWQDFMINEGISHFFYFIKK